MNPIYGKWQACPEGVKRKKTSTVFGFVRETWEVVSGGSDYAMLAAYLNSDRDAMCDLMPSFILERAIGRKGATPIAGVSTEALKKELQRREQAAKRPVYTSNYASNGTVANASVAIQAFDDTLIRGQRKKGRGTPKLRKKGKRRPPFTPRDRQSASPSPGHPWGIASKPSARSSGGFPVNECGNS